MSLIQKIQKRHKSVNRIILAIVFNAIVIVVIAVLSLFLFQRMFDIERDNCWNILEDSTSNIENQITMKMEDNINVLRLIGESMMTENRFDLTEKNVSAINSHLNDFQEMTIFSRIDILYENGKILIQNEGLEDSPLDFDEIAQAGIHISQRMTDNITGNETVYCAVPIQKNDKIIAILFGVIECERLPDIFNTSMYDGQTFACIVDRMTGDFIMDPWHETLGNVDDGKSRKILSGYADVDIGDEILKGNTGVVAYESSVNGKNSYMYYKPIANLDWQLLVVVQEDAVFSSLYQLRDMLFQLGIIEGIIISYLIWTVLTLNHTIKSSDEFERLSNTDAGTGANNRQALYHRYESIYGKENVGIVFCDITGLKEVNDTLGHNAGDALIRDTYDSLKAGFDVEDIYRIGGDEFVVINIGKYEQEIIDRIQKVQNTMDQKKINVAIGEAWLNKIDDNIEPLLREAEKKMYVQKDAWYRQSGKDRRCV